MLSTRDGNGGSFNGAAHSGEQHHKRPKSSELSKGSSDNGVRTSVSHDDVASVSGEDTTHGGGRILDDCGLLPNNCLPCIASAVGVNEKKRALSSSPTHSMKMPSLKLSFKKKSGEAHMSSTLCKHFFISRYGLRCLSQKLNCRLHQLLPTCYTFHIIVFVELKLSQQLALFLP